MGSLHLHRTVGTDTHVDAELILLSYAEMHVGIDEYVLMGESTRIEAIVKFAYVVVNMFGPEI